MTRRSRPPCLHTPQPAPLQGALQPCPPGGRLHGHYYLAAEYHGCRRCGGTYRSTDPRLVAQLSDSLRDRYPVVTSHRFAIDRTLLGLMRGRTLGNSPTALAASIAEQHSEDYCLRSLAYLGDCDRHR